MEFKKAKNKRARLLEQIKKMRYELENSFNNNDVTKLENDLEAEKLRLQNLYQDTQGQNKVRQLQKAALDEQEIAGDKLKGKESEMMNKFREMKIKYKRAQEMQRKLMAEIKGKHGEIIGLEQKQKVVQNAVQAQKDKGYTPQTSKIAMQNEHEKNQNAQALLEDEIKEKETTKLETDRNNKTAMNELDQKLIKIRSHVKLLEVQLKEKDQELKLVELKVRELKKRLLPAQKGKPLRQSRSNRTNLSLHDSRSVDNRTQDVQDAESAYGKKQVNGSLSSIQNHQAFRKRKLTHEQAGKRNLNSKSQRKPAAT